MSISSAATNLVTDLAAADYEEVRSEVATNCKEGVMPETSLDDWGDYDKDHTDKDHHDSFGDVKTFYIDHHQPEDITFTTT